MQYNEKCFFFSKATVAFPINGIIDITAVDKMAMGEVVGFSPSDGVLITYYISHLLPLSFIILPVR